MEMLHVECWTACLQAQATNQLAEGSSACLSVRSVYPGEEGDRTGVGQLSGHP